MWLVLIGISVGCFLLFWVMDRHLYKKEFESLPTDRLKIQVIHTYSVTEGNTFALYPNFSNFTFSLLRKMLRADICIALMEFFSVGWVTYIYLIFLAMTFFTYFSRKTAFEQMDEGNKPFIVPVFKAASRLPVFDSICFILVCIARVFVN